VSRDRVVLTLLALATMAGAPAFAAPAPGAADATRLQALDCDAVDAASVHDVLANAPAPRVILINGSLPTLTLDPVARFLVAMGYPRSGCAIRATARCPSAGTATACASRGSSRGTTSKTAWRRS
jgi:hypothetical protein